MAARTLLGALPGRGALDAAGTFDAAVSTMSEADPDAKGRMGDYEIVRCLGRGPAGSTYLARPLVLGPSALVALRVLSSDIAADADLLERIHEVAETLACSSLETCPTLYEIGAEAGREYLVRRYVEGSSLWALRQRAPGPLPLGIALHVAASLCEALDDLAARRERAHPVLGPSNLLFTPQGTLQILDLETACAASERGRLQATGAVYFSPEHERGCPDVRSDVYTAGVVLFDAVAELGAWAEDADVIADLAAGRLPSWRSYLGDTPIPVALILRRALAARPEERFRCCHELASALRGIAREVAPDGSTRLGDLVARMLEGRTTSPAPSPPSPDAEGDEPEHAGTYPSYRDGGAHPARRSSPPDEPAATVEHSPTAADASQPATMGHGSTIEPRPSHARVATGARIGFVSFTFLTAIAWLLVWCRQAPVAASLLPDRSHERPAPPLDREALAEAVGTGGLRIVVVPATRVQIEGHDAGRTPVSAADLRPGLYRVSLARSTQVAARRHRLVQVFAGATTRVRIEVERRVGAQN